MSLFQLAVPTILKHEGGFVNDPNDLGGPTNFGISLRFLQKSGYIGGDLDHDGDIDIDDIKKMTREQATEIYELEFWNKYQYNKINDQNLATKLFDLCVNMGSKQAHKLIQRALWSITGYLSIADDGILGPKSFAAINMQPANQLLMILKSEAAGFYRSLVKGFPGNGLHKYEDGWLRRAYS